MSYRTLNESCLFNDNPHTEKMVFILKRFPGDNQWLINELPKTYLFSSMCPSHVWSKTHAPSCQHPGFRSGMCLGDFPPSWGTERITGSSPGRYRMYGRFPLPVTFSTRITVRTRTRPTDDWYIADLGGCDSRERLFLRSPVIRIQVMFNCRPTLRQKCHFDDIYIY